MTAYELRISAWRSDVCSSDLSRVSSSTKAGRSGRGPTKLISPFSTHQSCGSSSILSWRMVRQTRVIRGDRKSVGSGKSVSVRVDLAGRRNINKKKQSQEQNNQ